MDISLSTVTSQAGPHTHAVIHLQRVAGMHRE
jgi:hypothetical protein